MLSLLHPWLAHPWGPSFGSMLVFLFLQPHSWFILAKLIFVYFMSLPLRPLCVICPFIFFSVHVVFCCVDYWLLYVWVSLKKIMFLLVCLQYQLMNHSNNIAFWVGSPPWTLSPLGSGLQARAVPISQIILVFFLPWFLRTELWWLDCLHCLLALDPIYSRVLSLQPIDLDVIPYTRESD